MDVIGDGVCEHGLADASQAVDDDMVEGVARSAPVGVERPLDGVVTAGQQRRLGPVAWREWVSRHSRLPAVSSIPPTALPPSDGVVADHRPAVSSILLAQRSPGCHPAVAPRRLHSPRYPDAGSVNKGAVFDAATHGLSRRARDIIQHRLERGRLVHLGVVHADGAGQRFLGGGLQRRHQHRRIHHGLRRHR